MNQMGLKKTILINFLNFSLAKRVAQEINGLDYLSKAFKMQGKMTIKMYTFDSHFYRLGNLTLLFKVLTKKVKTYILKSRYFNSRLIL
ncbi:hypothetical protein SAMN05443253_104214 [Bacillus sp. OK048]|nr:hypothetical protein SAMN05443253_104214 [Bacillus sp. OK048]